MSLLFCPCRPAGVELHSLELVVCWKQHFISVGLIWDFPSFSILFLLINFFRLWLELLLAVESLLGLHAVRAGLHADGGLRHLPLPGLGAVRGEPGLPGRLHRGDAGHAAALLQLSEQVHGGHEVRMCCTLQTRRSETRRSSVIATFISQVPGWNKLSLFCLQSAYRNSPFTHPSLKETAPLS